MPAKHAVTVVDYNPQWPSLFEQEAAKIKMALGDNCVEIHHVGSTSIPHLAAKPLIDIVPVVRNIIDVDLCVSKMEQLGYQTKGENGIAFRRFFQKGHPHPTHNVHIYEQGSPEIEHNLLFRNYLRTHANERDAYGALKKQLAMLHPDDINTYWLGKEAFIQALLNKLDFKGYRMVQAVTPNEWAIFERLCGIQPISLSQNVNELHSKYKRLYHFVFIIGTNIMACAQIEFINESEATLENFELEPSYQHKGHEVKIRALIDKWLHQQGRALS